MAKRTGHSMLKDKQAPVHNILEKYNYGNGFGWCAKRDQKRAKASKSKATGRK
jgi:hypothetical protein